MISIKGLLILLKLPVRLAYQILRYIFIGSPYRKFKYDLVSTLKLTVFRAAVSLPIYDAKILAVIKLRALLNTVIPLGYKSITKDLHNYGKRFDANSFWLVEKPNRSKSDPVIVYLHGGGYFVEIAPSQVESLIAIHQLVNPEKRKNVSILILDYKLACHKHTMPTQLYQLDATYKFLLTTSDNIILFGDSAGGNLAITYLQKLRQRDLGETEEESESESEKRSIPYPTKLILISPWVKFQLEPYQLQPGASYYDNYRRDMIQYTAFTDLSRAKIVGDQELDSLLVSPGNKKPHLKSDWDIPSFRDKDAQIFLLVGEDESFRDDILHWAEYALGIPYFSKHTYGNSNNSFDSDQHEYVKRTPYGSNVRLFVEPWGLHDSIFFFENTILRALKKNRNLKVEDLDKAQYFGITRVVEFLNDTL